MARWSGHGQPFSVQAGSGKKRHALADERIERAARLLMAISVRNSRTGLSATFSLRHDPRREIARANRSAWTSMGAPGFLAVPPPNC